MCKDMEIYPISRVCKSLRSKELNLKYYCPFEKQMKAICKTLENNNFIQELNLQDNWLSVESCSYLANVLELNDTLRTLKMKECRIGPEGMVALSEALGSSSIRDLDLSFNSLGNDGLKEAIFALTDNMNLVKLNLSHNGFTEQAAVYLNEILSDAYCLEVIDLSWNNFNTPAGMKKLCHGLVENKTINWISLAWNGIASEDVVIHFLRYLRKSSVLKFIDLSNNLLKDDPMTIFMNGVSESNSLVHVKIGNNAFSPSKAFTWAQLLAKPRDKPLKVLDMENMVVEKKFLTLLQKIKSLGNEVKYGTVLADYELYGPCVPKVLFGRCKYLAMKPKKKKKRVDFGHFVLSLPEKPITTDEFQAMLAARKLNHLLDFDLITALQNQYIMKKTQKVNCSQLISDYMVLYPETQPEPPRKKKEKKGGKGKKNKKKTLTLEEPVHEEAIPSAINVQDISVSADKIETTKQNNEDLQLTEISMQKELSAREFKSTEAVFNKQNSDSDAIKKSWVEDNEILPENNEEKALEASEVFILDVSRDSTN
ncbi:hypothetical protein HHI36_000224 [Cryptolaemus montrouzieri]|uniref:Uncharacterized protein n=1 Tax=Cryptolaemus montrouzieri TaxID=559131 RepID=A0ABD2P496_9CUCU